MGFQALLLNIFFHEIFGKSLRLFIVVSEMRNICICIKSFLKSLLRFTAGVSCTDEEKAGLRRRALEKNIHRIAHPFHIDIKNFFPGPHIKFEARCKMKILYITW